MTGKQPLNLNGDYLSELIDGRYREARLRGRELAAQDYSHLDPDLSLAEKRQHTIDAVVEMAKSGLPKEALPASLGGAEKFADYVASFEELTVSSPSMQIKAGVQFGLFGGAIQHLGSQRHHEKWLLDVAEGRLLGSFAMTEIGHGSDVARVGTTATYNPETQEFTIHTPYRQATKEYIGNAACHAQAAVVFAQLITGRVNYGVHAFFVPVRDEEGNPLPGVRIEDDGHKGGLLGVDNGRFAFDAVTIPRFNLLDRYGAVAEDGTYSSPIESPGRRFFTMLGTLVQGRVSLDGASNTASKLALDIAIRYAHERRQFEGAVPGVETRLIDYGRHQRRLMPRLARVWADSIAHDGLLEKFQNVFSGADDSDEERQHLETFAAGFKSVSTWNALDTIQECREACGGAGFLAENRLVGLHADLDVYVTFEGDNTVLLQLVGKRLLQDYAAELKHIDFKGVARYVSTQAAERTLYRSGVANAGRTIGDIFTPALNAKRIRSGKLQEALLESRVNVMIADLAEKMRPATKMNSAAAATELFNQHQNQLVETARAYIELLKWRALNERMHSVDAAAHPDEAKVIRRIRDLYGLTLIEENVGWHLMYGRLSMARARMLDDTIGRLCSKLAQNSLDLVKAFGYSESHRRASISSGIEARRQEEAAAYYRTARAKSDYPVDEKTAAKRK